MNLSLLPQLVARRLPDAPAMTCGGESLSYAGFERQVAAIAGALRDRHGLVAGDRVVMALENGPEFLPLLCAIWRAGLVAVPANARLHPREFAYILEHSGARLCIASPGIAATLPAGYCPVLSTGSADYARLLSGEAVGVVDTPGSANAWIFYTSGTTGRPKGATLTHDNLLFMLQSYLADIDQLDERDTMLHAAPLSHGGGLYALPHLARGSHNVILPGSFDPEGVLAAFAQYRNVSMFAAPTMVTRLLASPQAGGDTGGLKCLIYGGAPMYLADLERALELFGPRLHQIFGLGETPMTITHLSRRLHAERDHPRWRERLASSGIARTGVEVRVVGDDGQPLPVGAVGEIAARSPCVMRGYWNDPAATAKTIRDGWLLTGDLGVFDAEGFLTISGRSKDMIISGGSNIYPREIEEVLLQHPAVAEVSVVGAPHADWGEEVVAFVVPRAGDGLSAAVLEGFCLDQMARYKRPRRYLMVESLPKNNYGKVLKTELRERLKGRAT